MKHELRQQDKCSRVFDGIPIIFSSDLDLQPKKRKNTHMNSSINVMHIIQTG